MGKWPICVCERPDIRFFESKVLQCPGENEKIVGERRYRHAHFVTPDEVK